MRRIGTCAVVALMAYGCVSTANAPAPPSKATELLHGTASWYGQEFAGRTTANGEIFDPMLMTAAHRTLPFGTILDVKNPKSGQTVRVRINDRGPFVGNRLIDLSYAAAQQIGLIDPGSGDVDLDIIKVGAGDREPPAPYIVAIKEPQEKISTDAVRVEVPAPPPPQGIAPPPPVAAVPVVVDSVQVVEERHGVDSRRQVAADGRTIESVPIDGSTPSTKRDVKAPRGHDTASALDQAQHQNLHPTEEPRVTRPLPAQRASGKYVVQVGAFSVEGNAKALQRRLTKIGLDSYVAHTNLYHVRLGPFPTREQAIKAREKLESAGMSAIVMGE
ncbi:MAG: septal ring lytic transglycosylase RlpA family protein [Acidobacteriota bacterium]